MPRTHAPHALAAALAAGLVACAAAAGAADAPRPAPLAERAESRLIVHGTLDVDADGKVAGYALEQPDALPKGIRDMVARNAPAWRFGAVPGAPVARMRMSLAFVAKKSGGKDFRVELRNASFHDPGAPLPVVVKPGRRMPVYPERLLHLGVAGMAYVTVEIGPDGAVNRLDVGCVDLRTAGSEEDMALWRDLLARASVSAVRRWRYERVPGTPPPPEPGFVGIIPVDYSLNGAPKRYGRWETYLPGPVTPIPWAGADADGCPRARTESRLESAAGRRLLTPVGAADAPPAAPGAAP